MRTFKIKRIFIDYFEHHSFIENERVALRLYEPYNDIIYPKFSVQDWKMIFTDVDESSFIEMGKQYIDRVILVAIDKLVNVPFGFICIQDSHDTPMEVCFHGGTWEHDIKHILLEYTATDLILNFLINKNFEIIATCFLTNTKADRFQKSLGFVEYKRDNIISYKRLNKNFFYDNIVRKRNSLKGILNPWLNISWENTVADCDKGKLNPAYCAEKGIDISLLPEPYSGNLNSNVVCLNLNPGIGKCDACFRYNEQLLKLTQKTLCHKIDHSMWLDDEIRCRLGGIHEGCEWWKNRTKELKDAVGKRLNMFILEFFPYHTKHAFRFPDLPSNKYRNQLLSDAIDENKLLIIMRGENRWLGIKEFNLGERLKEMKEGNKLIVLSNPQKISFSRMSIGDDMWESLVYKLKKQ